MANLDATDLLDLQGENATNEKRFSQLGLIDLAKDSTPFVDYISPTQKAELAAMSSLRDLQIPVIKDQTVTVVTTPGFEFIPANLSESDQYTFTAVDVFSGFRHYPAMYRNNALDEEFDKKEKMRNILNAMGSTVETLIAAELENRKTQTLGFTTQVSQGDGTFVFNAGTDTLEINKAAQKETMFHNLEFLLEANELPGGYRIVTNRAGLSVQKSEALKFGADNEKNLQALGFLGLDRMYESGNLAGGSDVFNGWFVRDGGIGVLENHPADFAAGVQFAGKEWSVSPTDLPWLRMRANIFTDTQATDGTSLISAGSSSDMIMTHFQEMAIWARFYIVSRFNSDLTTRANDVVKIKGLTT